MKTIGTLLFTLILSGFSAPRCGATVYQSNGSVASVQSIHDNQAHDGDTIVVPAGTFRWTSPLRITKGITLQGATTISGAGTSAPVVNDNTIILDDVPRVANSTIIRVRVTPAQTPRITGITFRYGALRTSGTSCLALNASGATPGKMRIDHCHFDQLYEGWLMWVNGWNNGVADNNVMHVRGRSFPFQIRHDEYGGASQTLGNGAWADYPWYGTDKFWFIETNTIIRIAATAPAAALVDGDHGARWVIRHNYIVNCLLQGHGTEGGAARSQRANEVYNNVFNITLPYNANGGARGGTQLWHDNVYLGYEPTAAGNLANYRLGWTRNDPVWGISDGTSVWDRNDTEGNGTYVEGHPPFLFASGRDTSSVHSRGVMHDSTKNWATNQWAGYSIRNTNPAVNLGAYIISNTSNTITYWWGTTAGNRQMIFNAGDTYEIHRVLTVMDGCGMGKGDQVMGTPQPINTTVGRPFWNHEATEPCYSWNNVYSPHGHVLGFRGSDLQVLPPRENIEYFNLGGGFPADTTPLQVRSSYLAALNGVDYVGPFVYPHPLTLLPVGTPRAAVADLNGDGHLDWVLQNAGTHQTAIWYLNNNVIGAGAYGPTLPGNWGLRGVGNFNRDSQFDYALFALSTHQTAIWYLSGPTFIRSAYGPTLPSGWELVATADFNGDSKADYLLYNSGTRRSAIWYLNNSVFVSAAWGPTLSTGWSLVGTADFDRNGHTDYLLFNSITRQTAIWYLSGPTFLTGAYGPGVPSGWALVAAADFNGDGKPDYLLYNVNTQQTVIWYLNNNVFVSSAYGPTLPPGWSFFGP